MLVRIAAASDGADEQRALAQHEPPQQPRRALAERLVAALRRGDEARPRAEVVDGPEHEGAREQDALGDQREAVVRLPEGARASGGGRCSRRCRSRAGRATLTMAAREKRGTTTASAATRLPASRRRGEHEQARASPPIQIDAAARCAQSSASISPTGLVVAGWPARPGSASAAAAQAAAPKRASRASPERRARPGRSSSSASAGCDARAGRARPRGR